MFSKSKTSPGDASPTAARMADAGRKGAPGGAFSVLGPDVEINGNIAADGDLHVDGTVKGNVACKALVLGESGRVEGDIRADDVRLSGSVEGNVDAGSLTILAPARTKGDIRYDSLSIEQGAQCEGGFALRSGGGDTLKLVADGGD